MGGLKKPTLQPEDQGDQEVGERREGREPRIRHDGKEATFDTQECCHTVVIIDYAAGCRCVIDRHFSPNPSSIYCSFIHLPYWPHLTLKLLIM